MSGNSRVISYSAAALVFVTCSVTLFAAPMASTTPAKAQITVLYDAFGKTPGMQKDWGYSTVQSFSHDRSRLMIFLLPPSGVSLCSGVPDLGHQNVANKMPIRDKFQRFAPVAFRGIEVRRSSVEVGPRKVHQ